MEEELAEKNAELNGEKYEKKVVEKKGDEK